MEIIMLIADLAGVIGMGFFLKAEIFQLRKILRTKMTDGISRTAYTDKLLAITATMFCFWLTSLWLSFIVLFVEGVIAFVILHLMKKYSWKTLPKKEFLKELETW